MFSQSPLFLFRRNVDTYIYEGPVLLYGKVIAHYWTGETTATTLKKAKSNLVFKFKKDHGYSQKVVIDLPGKIYISRS